MVTSYLVRSLIVNGHIWHPKGLNNLRVARAHDALDHGIITPSITRLTARLYLIHACHEPGLKVHARRHTAEHYQPVVRRRDWPGILFRGVCVRMFEACCHLSVQAFLNCGAKGGVEGGVDP